MSFDTSRARAEIMQRIRAAQRRSTPTTSDLKAADDYLAQHPPGPQPSPYADCRAQFCAMAERMSSTVEAVASMTEAPAAVARYLTSQSLAQRAVAWPALKALPWQQAGIEVEWRAPRRDESGGADLVGVTGCFCAIAETGTLVLLSSPESPASTHLLPETHIALVDSARIVPTMEDAFELMRRERGGPERMMPRAINMVSGPSRTGDIEQTIVLGAHGPYRVHIVIAIGEPS
jgi:L-lactate dehydrogenase complex protein LldG